MQGGERNYSEIWGKIMDMLCERDDGVSNGMIQGTFAQLKKEK